MNGVLNTVVMLFKDFFFFSFFYTSILVYSILAYKFIMYTRVRVVPSVILMCQPILINILPNTPLHHHVSSHPVNAVKNILYIMLFIKSLLSQYRRLLYLAFFFCHYLHRPSVEASVSFVPPNISSISFYWLFYFSLHI